MTLTKGHISKAKFSVHTYIFIPQRNPYPGHNSLLSVLMGMILHSIIVHDTGVVVAGAFVPLKGKISTRLSASRFVFNITIRNQIYQSCPPPQCHIFEYSFVNTS